MAVEKKRGCGYRKVGGLYLVGSGIATPCDRIPFILEVCSVCGQGIKHALGFTWMEWQKFAMNHSVKVVEEIPNTKLLSSPYEVPCKCPSGLITDPEPCPICFPKEGKYGLLWVGKKFYTPGKFIKEALEMGVSKRIAAIPKELKIGETWILLAHVEGTEKEVPIEFPADKVLDPKEPITEKKKVPAIFYAFRPTKIEKIVTETQSKDTEEMEKLTKRGITPVIVPDNDKDHQGSVYEKGADDPRFVYGKRKCKDCGSKKYDIVLDGSGKKVREIIHNPDCPYVKHLLDISVPVNGGAEKTNEVVKLDTASQPINPSEE